MMLKELSYQLLTTIMETNHVNLRSASIIELMDSPIEINAKSKLEYSHACACFTNFFLSYASNRNNRRTKDSIR